MNGYERIICAIRGEMPDQVPIMLHNFMMAAREAGYTQAQYRSDPKKVADTFIRAVEAYEYDGIYVDIDTATLAGAVGVPVDYPENEPARCHQGSIGDLDEVRDLPPPDVAASDRIQIWIESVRLLKQHFGDEICIRGNCDQAPFSLASAMRTPADWMMDLMDEDRRENVKHLLEYCTDATCQFIRLMAEAGAHMISNGDSSAGPDMISPQMYERFALPYERRVADETHGKGIPYVIHICGNTTLILDMLLSSGADGVELDYKTDVDEARRVLGDTLCFFGNIDPCGVLAFGSVDDVVKQTRRLLEIFADTPRFVLNAGCALPPETPSENLQAMIRTAREIR